ncbi:MAG TPA: hypothetical protein VLJ76_08840, partial [Gaiellaceae bacterium]|nr:hypothetical protein [Gaiellaceae bacterium]
RSASERDVEQEIADSRLETLPAMLVNEMPDSFVAWAGNGQGIRNQTETAVRLGHWAIRFVDARQGRQQP